MKDELRGKLKNKRNLFCGAARKSADAAIAKTFLDVCGAYDSYFIYNAFSSEAATSSVIDGLVAAGKKVYLPRVEGENIVAVPFGKTEKGAFGIFEPTGQAYAGEADVTVVPLLAVNKRGYRIGYGKGYYDRYLKGRKTLKVGLGYGFQIEDFQEDAWDEPLDVFICENGIYRFKK